MSPKDQVVRILHSLDFIPDIIVHHPSKIKPHTKRYWKVSIGKEWCLRMNKLVVDYDKDKNTYKIHDTMIFRGHQDYDYFNYDGPKIIIRVE